MVTFVIHHGVKLRSSGAQLVPFQRYSTEREDEIEELRGYGEKFKLCTEVVPEKPKETPKPAEDVAPADPAEDLALMKGIVGKATATKLAALEIVTQSGLKAALADAEKKAKVTEAVGEKVVEKMDAFFSKGSDAK